MLTRDVHNYYVEHATVHIQQPVTRVLEGNERSISVFKYICFSFNISSTGKRGSVARRQGWTPQAINSSEARENLTFLLIVTIAKRWPHLDDARDGAWHGMLWRGRIGFVLPVI